MSESITPYTAVTLTVSLKQQFSCLDSGHLNQVDVFILGAHEALGEDMLNHAKAFR